jgi:hypothetical protein
MLLQLLYQLLIVLLMPPSTVLPQMLQIAVP